MALLPTLTLITVAQDASSITVADGTGDYSVSNTGGFGAPNPLEANITGIILDLYSLCDTDVITSYRPTTTTAILSAGGELIAAASFAGVTTGATYADGVYGIKYNVLFAGVGNLTFTGGSKQFTLANASTVLASAVGFVLASDLDKVYYIDTTKTLDGTSGWVTEALPDTGATVAIEVAYQGDLKILVDKAGSRCLTEDIAVWANEGCKDDNYKNIWTRHKQRIALQSKFTQGYLNDAHKLALSLADYCDCTIPYVTCSC